MEKKTIYATLALLIAGGLAVAVLRSPEKGEIKGPRPRPIAAFTAKDVTALEIISEKQQKVTLEKTGDKWMLKTPLEWPADQQNVKSLVEGLEKLKFGDEVSDNASKHEDFGVVGGKAAHLTAKGAGGKVLADFYVGKPLSGYTMIRPATSNSTWQANGIYPYMLSRDAKDWRNHNVIEFSSADGDKLTVEANGQKLVLEKSAPPEDKDKKDPTPSDMAWKIVESTGAGPKTSDALDQAQANGAVQALSSLRATDFADGKTPAETGLDQPTLTVTVKAKGKDYSLIVGRSQGEDVFVKAADGAAIYLLKRTSAERVLHHPIDYRDKTLTKVKDVDLAGIDIAVGSEHISLDHKGDNWTSKSAVDDAKVKSLVGAFENLGGSSFLDKPIAGPIAGTATLRLKDGKKILLRIGAALGDDYPVQKIGSPDVIMTKKYQVDRFLKKPADLAPAAKTAKK